MSVGGIGINKGAFAEGSGTDAIDNIGRVIARLDTSEIDLIAVGRAMIADADWANKMLRGQRPKPYHPDLLKHLR